MRVGQGQRRLTAGRVHGLSTTIGTSNLSGTKDAVNEAEAKVITQLQRVADRRSGHR